MSRIEKGTPPKRANISEKVVGSNEANVTRISQGRLSSLPTSLRKVRDFFKPSILVTPKAQAKQTLDAAKQIEREAVFTALKRADADCKEFLQEIEKEIPSLQDVYFIDKFEENCKNNIARELYRKTKEQGKNFSIEEARDLSAQFYEKGVFQAEKYQLTRTFDQNFRKYVLTLRAVDTKKNEVHPDNLHEKYAELVLLTRQIHHLLQSGSTSAKKNKEITDLLSQASSCTAYKFLRNNEKNPAVRYLHILILSLHANVNARKAFEKLSIPMNSFQKARDATLQAGFHGDDKTICYMLYYGLKKLFSAFKSQWFVPGKYDPSEIENYPGLLYSRNVGNVQHISTYNPTPTVGDAPSPLFEALLQAAENRHLMTLEELETLPKYSRATAIFYCGLQNRTDPSEQGRTTAIEKICASFPISATALSIDADSDFIRGGLHAKTPQKMKDEKRQNGTTGVDDAYRRALFVHITSHPNYHFPIEIQKWESDLGKIINEAYRLFEKQNMLGSLEAETNWDRKAAFREMVTQGIIQYWELKSSPRNGQLLCLKCCKECIDRGMTKNAADLLYLGEKAETAYAIQTSQGRAPFARKRAILPDRFEQVVAYEKTIPYEHAHIFLTDFIPKLAKSPSPSNLTLPNTET